VIGMSSERGSRHESERVDMECPQGCQNPGGLRRVTEYTGKVDYVEIYGELVESERTRTWLECPTCGWVMDV